MRKSRPRPGILLWLFWVLATIVGWTARRLLWEVPQLSNLGIFFLVSFFANGLVIGTLHWILLRRYLRASGWRGFISGLGWIGVSGFAWLLAWSFFFLFPTLYTFAFKAGYSLLTISLMAGGGSSLLSGAMQAFIMRRAAPRVWLWIPIHIVSMVAAMYAHQNIPITQPTLAFALGGLVFGALSGTGLLYLLGQNNSSPTPFSPPESKQSHPTPDFR